MQLATAIIVLTVLALGAILCVVALLAPIRARRVAQRDRRARQRYHYIPTPRQDFARGTARSGHGGMPNR